MLSRIDSIYIGLIYRECEYFFQNFTCKVLGNISDENWRALRRTHCLKGHFKFHLILKLTKKQWMKVKKTSVCHKPCCVFQIFCTFSVATHQYVMLGQIYKWLKNPIGTTPKTNQKGETIFILKYILCWLETLPHNMYMLFETHIIVCNNFICHFSFFFFPSQLIVDVLQYWSHIGFYVIGATFKVAPCWLVRGSTAMLWFSFCQTAHDL